ncbi:hypothetical protein AVEN_233556-1 [Araneus ventricosus]|uniref:Uncharacterized protein n=1 Tax=Araneus ventricosus TaxID=182803 RepID=A0A4Y2TJ68_ARAVE|nr:hypothetical protein AVEN_233556-1 [Araneus ventricosus]
MDTLVQNQLWKTINCAHFAVTYYSATDSETTTFGRFYTGKGCQAMSYMRAFPEFFVRSRSVKCKHNPSILHFPPTLMKTTSHGACAKARRASESVAIQYLLHKPQTAEDEKDFVSPGCHEADNDLKLSSGGSCFVINT